MSRRSAREKAFLLLYQLEFQQGDEAEQIEVFLVERDVAAGDQAYVRQLVRGVRAERERLDAEITPWLKRWTIDRLPRVDLSILRLALYEMRHVDDVPESVAISEAVSLCRRYAGDESRAYINAVLGKLVTGVKA